MNNSCTYFAFSIFSKKTQLNKCFTIQVDLEKKPVRLRSFYCRLLTFAWCYGQAYA